jgi:hypothetical protein
MRPIGFSTGALAKSDFAQGVALQRAHERISAVELSALRDHELEPLVQAAASLDLSGFEYISVHAPSKLATLDERTVFGLLSTFPAEWPLIVHPEILLTPELWRTLGPRLCIENMDGRKTLGRTAAELRSLFVLYPEATFCLDVGHARQIDPTMAVALLMLFEFGTRLRQVHVSDVGSRGEHLRVSMMARWAFERVAPRLPESCPLIIESVIAPDAMAVELDRVLEAFSGERSSGTMRARAPLGSAPTHAGARD